MTPETTKQLDSLQQMYDKGYSDGVDDALNLVAAAIKARRKSGYVAISNARLLELIETSRENFKGK